MKIFIVVLLLLFPAMAYSGTQYSQKYKVTPKVVDDRLDIKDLQKQIKSKYHAEIKDICLPKPADKREICITGFHKIEIEHYRGTLEIYRDKMSVSEYEAGAKWKL